MCHERWLRHRDEVIATRWLRDLERHEREKDDAPLRVADLRPSDSSEAAREREPVAAGDR
jgi:hypothetical protein